VINPLEGVGNVGSPFFCPVNLGIRNRRFEGDIILLPANRHSSIDDGRHLAFTRYFFRSKALLWGSITLLLPPPHLQSLPYCNTIARLLHNIRPPIWPSLCMPYTIQYWRWQYRVKVKLAFTRYCYCQYCMVYSIHTGGRKGSLIRSNHRAIVLH